MIIRNFFKVVSLLVLVVAFSSCEYDWIKSVDANTQVSFSNDIQPILTSKCVSCHNGTKVSINYSEGVAYQTIINNNLVDTDNPSQSTILNEAHALSKMSETDQQKILVWIQQGAKDN